MERFLSRWCGQWIICWAGLRCLHKPGKVYYLCREFRITGYVRIPTEHQPKESVVAKTWLSALKTAVEQCCTYWLLVGLTFQHIKVCIKSIPTFLMIIAHLSHSFRAACLFLSLFLAQNYPYPSMTGPTEDWQTMRLAQSPSRRCKRSKAAT